MGEHKIHREFSIVQENATGAREWMAYSLKVRKGQVNRKSQAGKGQIQCALCGRHPLRPSKESFKWGYARLRSAKKIGRNKNTGGSNLPDRREKGTMETGTTKRTLQYGWQWKGTRPWNS